MICQHCQRTIQGDFKFCPHCGAQASTKLHCPSCGKDTDPSWVTCPHCGYGLQGAIASTLRPFLNHPKHGYHHGSSSGHHYGGSSGRHHRKKGLLGHLFSSWTANPRIKGYTIEEYLGVGSFGAVVRATREGQSFALKAFMDSKDPEGRFKLEADILANLNNPRIPRYVEAFSQDNVNYLVQEYFHGYPLSYDIVQGAKLSETEVKKILSQLLTLLQFLHEPTLERPAVIHRDLRLSNLFWVKDKLYLVDFGLAEYFTGLPKEPVSFTVSGGTEDVLNLSASSYTLLRKEISPRSDLFGAGVVALDLFTNWIEEESSFQKPWQAILPASEEFIAYLERLILTKNQFASAGEAQQALRDL